MGFAPRLVEEILEFFGEVAQDGPGLVITQQV
jgi:hypothetical protein